MIIQFMSSLLGDVTGRTCPQLHLQHSSRSSGVAQLLGRSDKLFLWICLKTDAREANETYLLTSESTRAFEAFLRNIFWLV